MRQYHNVIKNADLYSFLLSASAAAAATTKMIQMMVTVAQKDAVQEAEGVPICRRQ